MKLIRYFVNITVAISIIGVLMLINDGELDVYVIWYTVALLGAAVYMHRVRHEGDKKDD